MESNSVTSIAFFDFDGTITSKDTLAEIIKFYKGKASYYFGLILLSPILIAYKIKLLSNHRAKEIMLRYFLGGTLLSKFNEVCIKFTKDILPGLLRKQALEAIRKHIENKTKVVVVSASPINWVKPWCDQYNLDCIATCLEIKDTKITGNISGENCSGEVKVHNIKNAYELKNYSVIYAYGDTPADKHMLALSNHKFYKPFKEKAY